ncbi:hypothetical protein R3X27_12825 [Tropicimonas sp. TH_r6]|uniref:hypothetical protein n=1 Tax=Tropicimonas sp. TH_r6 TaxID=3082085 RepID=UPI002953077F|nr:hypothetical protein [Tropicimonas sp. TH_r6]MDV7143562.1 hypothetical protein [Tropicimonas sp. TH_r6]
MKHTDRNERVRKLLDQIDAARDALAREYLSACIEKERVIPPKDFVPCETEILSEAYEVADHYAYLVDSGRDYDWVDASDFI